MLIFKYLNLTIATCLKKNPRIHLTEENLSLSLSVEFQCCVNDVCGKIVSQPNNDMPLSFVIIKASENPEKSLQVTRLNK